MLLRLILVTLLLVATAAEAQTMPYSSGQFAELNPGSAQGDTKLSVTVLSGAYALAWNNIDQRWAVTGDEKLYVLRFRIRNDGSQVESINPKSLQILVSDAQNRGFDDPLAFRLPGTTQSGDTRLVQSQSIDIETAFLIPADTQIASAYFADSRADPEAQVQFSVSSEASLPRDLSSDGVTVRPIVAAQQNTWYPLGVTDVRVDGVSVSDVAVLSYAPDDTTDIAVVNFDIRNRSDSDIRISRGMYRETSLTTAGGDRDLLGLLFKDVDRSTDFPLLPGTEVGLRGVFKIPKDAGIESIDFVEKIGRRGGELSRRYVVGVTGSGPTLPTGSSTIFVDGAPRPNPSRIPAGLPTGIPTDATTDVPTAELPPQLTGPGNTVVTLPPEQLPDRTSIPDGVIPQEEVEITVAADPMPLDLIGTIETVPFDIPSADYVVRMKDLTISSRPPPPKSEDDTEYQLMVFNYRGRFGELLISKESHARRDHVNSADTGRPGSVFLLNAKPKLRSDFNSVKPLEVMALVFVLIERDDSDGASREAYMQRLHLSMGHAFINELSRDLGVDYDNLTTSDRDKVITAFHRAAETFAATAGYGVPKNYDGLDDDDISPRRTFVWIHTDDASNPGIIANVDRHGRQTSYPFPWPEFIGAAMQTAHDYYHRLRFEISQE